MSDDNAIRDAYRQEFMNRLKHNKIDEHFENYEIMSNLLCDLYVTASRAVLSPDFTVEEAWKVLVLSVVLSVVLSTEEKEGARP